MKKVTKAVATLMLFGTMLYISGCKEPESIVTPFTVSGSNGGHDYVDLGLPSGTLWATCNIGAGTPEGYGDYFAWGDTSPKTTYNWTSYQYCMGDGHSFTKYCTDSTYGYNGFVDNLNELWPIDDAALVKGNRLAHTDNGTMEGIARQHDRHLDGSERGERIPFYCK